MSHLPRLAGLGPALGAINTPLPPNSQEKYKFQQKSQSALLLHSSALSPGARNIHGNASQAKSHIHCLLTGNFISKTVISENTYPSFLGRAAVGFAELRAGTAERRVTSRHHWGPLGRDSQTRIIQ